MSKENSFLENVVAVNNLNDKEQAFLHNIDVKRKYKSTGSASYKHKDGTTVIIHQHFVGEEVGASGLDIILVRDNAYVHFETIAEKDYKNGKLNITLGDFDNNEQKQLSYPMDAICDSLTISKTLTEKAPSIAETYNKYIPEDTHNMVCKLRLFKRVEKKNEETTFMAAFSKWNRGKGL